MWPAGDTNPLCPQVNFTGVVVSINEVAKNGSNYMPEEVAKSLDAKGRAQAVFGSKMTFVLEIFTLTATWTVKACLLLLYSRLTEGTSTRQSLAVKMVAGYCLVTYLLVTFMFVFFWCSPHVYEYWEVPVRICKSSHAGVFVAANWRQPNVPVTITT